MTQKRFNFMVACCFCIVWGILIIPVTHVEAGSGQKWKCNDPVDCSSSCSCTNTQVNPGGIGVACVHACTEEIQNYNKHKCKFTNNNNDNCPNETRKQCGKVKVKTETTVVKFRDCKDSDYANFTDCTDNDPETLYKQACD